MAIVAKNTRDLTPRGTAQLTDAVNVQGEDLANYFATLEQILNLTKASFVSVEDAAGNFTATDVEGVLAELKGDVLGAGQGLTENAGNIDLGGNILNEETNLLFDSLDYQAFVMRGIGSNWQIYGESEGVGGAGQIGMEARDVGLGVSSAFLLSPTALESVVQDGIDSTSITQTIDAIVLDIAQSGTLSYATDPIAFAGLEIPHWDAMTAYVAENGGLGAGSGLTENAGNIDLGGVVPNEDMELYFNNTAYQYTWLRGLDSQWEFYAESNGTNGDGYISLVGRDTSQPTKQGYINIFSSGVQMQIQDQAIVNKIDLLESYIELAHETEIIISAPLLTLAAIPNFNFTSSPLPPIAAAPAAAIRYFGNQDGDLREPDAWPAFQVNGVNGRIPWYAL